MFAKPSTRIFPAKSGSAGCVPGSRMTLRVLANACEAPEQVRGKVIDWSHVLRETRLETT
jgi:hypothetical protein